MCFLSLHSFSVSSVRIGLVMLLLLGWGGHHPFFQVSAHQVSSVSLISSFDTKEGTYELDAAMEVIPSEDDALNDEISPEDAAREFATEYLTILFDDEEDEPEMKIRRETTSDEATPAELQREQVIVTLTGTIPEGRENFLLYLDPSCPMAVVMVVVKDDRPARRMQVVLAGEYSRPVNILPLVEGDPFSLSEAKPSDPAAANKGKSTEKEGGASDDADSKSHPFLLGMRGFFHSSLLPVFFVVSLFLLTPRRTPVFLSIAGFLVGLCLAIALRGWALLPLVSWAPFFSGLLLAILGLEALVHGAFRWWRVALFAVAGFGSGLIIATTKPFRQVFAEASDAESFVGVIAFIFGAELAAVAVGIIAGLLLRLLFRFDWYQKSVVQPIAVLLTAYGVYQLISGLS
ncbi:MAG: hypothetical protein P1U85_10710 [Verrucomicrobiales bacterium]|nr:hypothetical protein [Verrucomicrobiales bacterium]